MTQNENAQTTEKRPLVATLIISESAQEYFNKLRKQHFPPEKNYLDAHLTLFHALPDQPHIYAHLKEVSQQNHPFEATLEGVVSLGFGTAFKITSPELPALHRNLQNQWTELLTNQDRQKRNFHITVQNKVSPETAKALKAELEADFKPFTFSISGIRLWRYLGGPWEYLDAYHFKTSG